eukprot:NODE_4870_length_729_cov_19.730897_g4707_i0.p1 GENE.NODE_4870_length_729_cov_19.730897_g4707_i0~~NODE_4870_length_729_cov_19.730897_g4707_i0.p1  ORF type:complete len:188 (-),score=21.84 NODE_4870_length_729_cov_19.730897_g4707_i0:9-572(-)
MDSNCGRERLWRPHCPVPHTPMLTAEWTKLLEETSLWDAEESSWPFQQLSAIKMAKFARGMDHLIRASPRLQALRRDITALEQSEAPSSHHLHVTPNCVPTDKRQPSERIPTPGLATTMTPQVIHPNGDSSVAQQNWSCLRRWQSVFTPEDYPRVRRVCLPPSSDRPRTHSATHLPPSLNTHTTRTT